MWELSKFGPVSLWEANGCLPGELQHNNNKPHVEKSVLLQIFLGQNFEQNYNFEENFNIRTTNLSTESDKNVFLM